MLKETQWTVEFNKFIYRDSCTIMMILLSVRSANKGGDFARFAVCTGHNGFRNGEMHRYALNGAVHANMYVDAAVLHAPTCTCTSHAVFHLGIVILTRNDTYLRLR